MITFDGVHVRFEAGAALADICLSVEPGALCVLVGPSGSSVEGAEP